jgi:hypothetical protein
MLSPFIAILPLETMAVGEAGRVEPKMRGSPLPPQLGELSAACIATHRIQLIFGPHRSPSAELLCEARHAHPDRADEVDRRQLRKMPREKRLDTANRLTGMNRTQIC